MFGIEVVPPNATIVALCLATIVISGWLASSSSKQRAPGPRGVPFFGNAFQIPAKYFATYLKELHSRHGGLVHLNIMGQHMFSIGDLDLAVELMEHRSNIYSSRSVLPFLDRYLDPEGLIWTITKSPSENHHWGRKMSTTVMKHVRAGHTEPLQRLEALALIHGIIGDKGRDWFERSNRTIASVTVAAMFGVNSLDGKAPEVAKVMELIDDMIHIIDPFATIINILPLVDTLLPAFIPTPWRRSAAKWIAHDSQGWDELFREALEGKGAQMSTWASMFADENKDKRPLLHPFAAAAIETTASSVHTFVLASLTFPGWIETAQQELDRVVGKDRLPDFSDRQALPFIEAIVREVLRWSAPIRTGLPHSTTADDVVKYKGKEYFIPKGSIIVGAPIVIDHDEERYESPEVFRPQRFLDNNGQLKKDYRTSAFGFGRRLCVGIPFAERSLWIIIATILWTFNIREAVDPRTGSTYEYKATDEAFDGRISNGPLPFPVFFEPRDEGRASVAQREWEDTEKDLNVLLPPLK